MNDDTVPVLVRTAGDAAVRACREMLDDARWSPITRRLWGERVGRFFRWAEAQGRTLETIDAGDWAAYAEGMAPVTARGILSALRRLAWHLVNAGVLSASPFPPTRRSKPLQSPLIRHRARPVDRVFSEPNSYLSELQALRRKLMAELNERYGDDPTFNLVKSIDRQLAVMHLATTGNAPGIQERSDAR